MLFVRGGGGGGGGGVHHGFESRTALDEIMEESQWNLRII